jgi:stage V sporulation protein G
MTISEINIQLVKPVNGLVAFASIVLDSQIYLSSIAVHQRLDGTGFRLTYPTKKIGDRSFHIFHPIEKEIGHEIERVIFSKLNALFNKSQHDNLLAMKGGYDADE